MSDRRDKFTYTDPRQIKVGGGHGQAEALRALRDFIEREGLDASKVLALVQDHLDEVHRQR